MVFHVWFYIRFTGFIIFSTTIYVLFCSTVFFCFICIASHCYIMSLLCLCAFVTLKCGLHRKLSLLSYHVHYHSFLQCRRRLRLETRKERIIFRRCPSLNSGALAVPRQPKNSGAATALNKRLLTYLLTYFT